jgi:hypothetical protein
MRLSFVLLSSFIAIAETTHGSVLVEDVIASVVLEESIKVNYKTKNNSGSTPSSFSKIIKTGNVHEA